MPTPNSKKPKDPLADIRKRIEKAPSDPGVYRWLDSHSHVLYVGKAKNLKNRLRSYVQDSSKKSLGPWKVALMDQVADLDFTVTNTELEALILETNLIKEEKPKYNVMMKDGKNYVYVRISIQDPYPTISITRKMEEDDAKYFGPYTKKYQIEQTLEMLHLVFPYRACKKSLDALNKDPETDFNEKSDACLEYMIGNCCGLCKGVTSHDDYNSSISSIVDFLKGNRTEAVTQIENLMTLFASEKKFEKAAELRDVLHSIKGMEEKQLASDTSGEDIDIIGIAIATKHVQVVLFQQRQGKLIGEETFVLSGQTGSKSDALDQFIAQYYSDVSEIPPLLVIGEDLEEKSVIEEWLSSKKGTNVELRPAVRGKKSQLLKLAEKNAEEKIKQLETKWETALKNAESALKELQEILSLPTPPKRIEAYDISHLGGTETVGSMVVARNGKAANDQYRSFTIRSLKEGDIDDYKAIREALYRRLLHLVRNIRAEEKQLKEHGITFGKPRKNEQESLVILMNSPDNKVSDILVVRKDKKLMGAIWIIEHKNKSLELFHPVFTDETIITKIPHYFFHRKLLSKQKKKVYVALNKLIVNSFLSIGFQYIHTSPISKDDQVVVMFDPKKNKVDSSLNQYPDLLVIDGGKGQLSTAVEVLKELNLEIPIIGLAKREEDVFLPGASFPKPFPKDSLAKFLLMRLRNESHRFANAHRERRGKKAAVHSALDDVPGIGDRTKQELLKKFGSLNMIKETSDEELLTILNQTQLQSLRETL